MRRLTVFAVVMSLAGCTTLQPIEGTSNELQARISSGWLLETGDRVSIVTRDDRTHEFRVLAIRDGVIQGKSDSVPLDRVVTVQKREFSRAKTFLLLGGIVLGVGLVLYAAAQVTPAFALGRSPYGASAGAWPAAFSGRRSGRSS